ncbi:flagellar basal body-associated FliL family protein [Albirhodobacter sp. R86504]|uniref:flagellar basal body-associated FliL family protein n=1 Tax=Albirhodobacter sp. R86504 TaxID=3093848 RepID=UPI00366B2E2E
MGKLIPIILALVGLGIGGGAGFALRPPPAEESLAEAPCGDVKVPEQDAPADPEVPLFEYVKINNQFVIPVVAQETIGSLVILSLSLEVKTGATQKVYAVEPKLRDAFLQVLFDHANTGGFDGAFTSSNNMDLLRNALFEVAKKTLGTDVNDVLVSDIIRQDT